MWRRGGRLGNGGSVRRMRHYGVGLGGAALETDRETNLDGSREEGLMDRKNKEEKTRRREERREEKKKAGRRLFSGARASPGLPRLLDGPV